MENSARIAIKDVQDAFLGKEERIGLKNEHDVVTMIKEIRRENWRITNVSNA